MGIHQACGGEALPLTEGDWLRVGWAMRPTGQKPGGLGRGAWNGKVEKPRLRQNMRLEGIVQVGLEEKNIYVKREGQPFFMF